MKELTLAPELEQFVRNEVASGRFKSESEVLTEAVRLLRARLIHHLRGEILVGVRELEDGNKINIMDDAELATFFGEVADEVDRELTTE